MRKLSAHFTLEELIFSEFAERNGIDNTPPPAVLANLERLALALDEVRVIINRPVIVSSGFRCEAIEREFTQRDYSAWCIGHGYAEMEQSWKIYFATKAHPEGRAGDIVSPQYGTPFQICQAIVGAGVEFDQLIQEYKWVHFGIAELGVTPRRQVLTLNPQGGYFAGLVESPAVA